MPEPAAGLLTATLAVATVAAVVDFTGMVVAPSGPGGAYDRVVWPLTNLGLGLFGAGMVRWAGTVPTIAPGTRVDLVRAWRRSARWAWTSLAVSLGAVVGFGVLAMSDERSFAATGSGDDLRRRGWIVFVAALVVGLGPVFSAAGSTARTRRVLAPPAAVRPGRRLAGGG
jgi:hypothetical protein